MTQLFMAAHPVVGWNWLNTVEFSGISQTVKTQPLQSK
jgi:hypothetical protein